MGRSSGTSRRGYMKRVHQSGARVFFGLHQKVPVLTAGVILPLIYLAALTVPLQAMLAILNNVSGIESDATKVSLPCTAKALLFSSGVLTALASLLAGGLAKWMYPKCNSRIVLLIHITAGAGAFLVAASMVREVQPDLSNANAGDNVWLLSYLAFWLLMAGYMLKAPWDESRDRVNTWIGKVSARYMVADEPKTVLNEGNAKAVAWMIGKLTDQEVTELYQMVNRAGPIADLAAHTMITRKIDL